jgi:uncharacterized protein
MLFSTFAGLNSVNNPYFKTGKRATESFRLVQLLCLLLLLTCAPLFLPWYTLHAKPASIIAGSPKELVGSKGALFQATKDGKVIHLFGTMHVGAKSDLPLGSATISRLVESEALLLEIDLSDPKTAHEFAKLSVAKQSLSFTDKQRSMVLAAARTMKIDDEKALNFRPITLVITLQLAQAYAAGLEVENGSDMFLLELALANKIQVIGMETVAEQFTFEDEFNEAELKRLVHEEFLFAESKRGPLMQRKMATAWSRGRLDELARISKSSRPWLTKKLLKISNKSNHRMIEKIVESSGVAVKPVFVAAGALHFWGSESIPLLLQKRGYTVERIH